MIILHIAWDIARTPQPKCDKCNVFRSSAVRNRTSAEISHISCAVLCVRVCVCVYQVCVVNESLPSKTLVFTHPMKYTSTHTLSLADYVIRAHTRGIRPATARHLHHETRVPALAVERLGARAHERYKNKHRCLPRASQKLFYFWDDVGSGASAPVCSSRHLSPQIFAFFFSKLCNDNFRTLLKSLAIGSITLLSQCVNYLQCKTIIIIEQITTTSQNVL